MGQWLGIQVTFSHEKELLYGGERDLAPTKPTLMTTGLSLATLGLGHM